MAVPTVGDYGKAKLQMKGRRAFETFFGNPEPGYLMHPLRHTYGPVFPFTPGLNVGYDSIYTSVQPMHSNFAYPVFQHHSLQPIIVSFTLISDTQENARYSLAVFHFVRSVMKMQQDGTDPNPDFNNTLPGTPPPVLNFSAYGDHMFRNVPVVIENFNFSVTNDKNMVEVELKDDVPDPSIPGTDVATPEGLFVSYVPLDWDMAVSLRPAFSPTRVRKEFSTSQFATGKLLRQGYQ